MNDPVTYAGGAILIALGCLIIYLVVSLVRADRKRKRDVRRYVPDSLGKETIYGTGVMPSRWFDSPLPVPQDYAEPRRKVYAADFPGDTPDERLAAALEWAQRQHTPPTIVVEPGAGHFRTLTSYYGIGITREDR